MTLSLHNTTLHILNMRTRIPFKYGIATMTSLPHVFVRVELAVAGRTAYGIASDHLPPKWFTKYPQTTFEEDIEEMLLVIRSAAEYSLDLEPAETVFDMWRELYGLQGVWAMDENLPPLLWGFGVSLVERAIIDAYCRATQTTFAGAVHSNNLGINLGELHPQLAGQTPAGFLPWPPSPTLIARHTVGLGDPLTGADISAGERMDDGLPQALEEVIDAYGITHFKLKLFGDPEQDIERLGNIARVIEAAGVSDYGFTLDGNENYKEIAPFRQLWASLSQNSDLADFMSHLLFVEQPLHRDVALSEATKAELLAWEGRPPIIIDESDAEIDSLPNALDCGYAGTSHKNCKGVFKGIANACLLEHYRRQNPGQTYLMSGEDLSNVGVALLQDSTVTAVLGIGHAERNSHHYFAGLSMYPQAMQAAILAQHSDLYHRHPAGFPTLTIKKGRINLGSVLQAPFGVGADLDPTVFTLVDEWDADSMNQ
jgi:hypothetical protein